ncbi:MAG: sterol desaturase family protein [Tateyamaria sp.]|uniref:sterol desaturase family protein n=1 Tax=Tateyamaria sp. TaxID=1929288 RepID=UPI00329C7ADD
MELIQDFVQYMLKFLTGMHSRLAVTYILCTILLAFAIWWARGHQQSFVSFLLPKKVFLHRSNLLDLKLFFAYRVVNFFGLFARVFFPTTAALWVLHALSAQVGEPVELPPVTGGRVLLATVIVVIAADFCKYWAHRWHHEIKVLWPFHAVHHSADVLTPITVERAHPVEPLIRNLFITVLVGLVQGILLFLMVGQTDPVTIGGANAMYVVFNALGSNLRHSHIWLSYGRVMEHLFISPAQHQVHHSVALVHHNKNYGSMFAIWDWMFGTLYICDRYEDLTYGVSDGSGKPKPQPYKTLGEALAKPFQEAREAWQDARAEAVATPAAMSPGFSLWLDLLRAAAALTVLFGHMAHIRFTRGDYYFLREWNVASDAVVVFFVLSGVVIAYAATRDGTLERFAFNRLTRLFSVIVPALIFTLIFDAWGRSLDASAYNYPFFVELPIGDFLLRGMTFTNEWQGQWNRVRLGTNGPLWSLSYEVAFYALFGVAVFLKGGLRWVLLALLVLMVGLPILILMPAWLMGVWVWHRRPASVGARPVRDWSWAILGLAALVVMKAAGLPAILASITAQAYAPDNYQLMLGYSDEFLWNGIIGLCVALHLAGVRNIMVRRQGDRAWGRGARLIRWVAGASFSIYVMHYPTLHLLDAILPETLPLYDLWLLGLALAVCFGFAKLFERPLCRVRSALRPGWESLGVQFRPIGSRAPRP